MIKKNVGNFIVTKCIMVIILLGLIVACEKKQVAANLYDFESETTIIVNQQIEYKTLEEVNEAPENITWLRISNMEINNTSWLKKLTNLENLYISNCKINDLKFISNYSEINNIDLLNSHIEDITPLKSLAKTSIDRIDIGNNDIKDISILSEIKSITSLSILGNPIIDISAVGTMENLETLVLSDGGNNLSGKEFEGLHDLSPIYNLKHLKFIQLVRFHDCNYDFTEALEKLGDKLDIH